MAKLAVFDIDSTLCDTNFVDGACFVQAVAEFLEVDPSHIDWSDAPHITDSGLLDWLCVQYNRRAPAASDRNTIVDRFVELLHARDTSTPDAFLPVPGAGQGLSALEAMGWDTAIATGGWQRSALFKLTRIGMDAQQFVLATADDAVTRADIIRTAILRAEARYGRSYSRVVSIGDAAWDVRTAAELGLPFIGIADVERATKLRQLGATTILADYADLRALYHALDNATVPFDAGVIVSAWRSV